MGSYVPDFEFDGSSPRGENRTARGDEEIMELLWNDGELVTQTQNQRSIKKQTNAGNAEIPFLQSYSNGREIPSVEAETLSQRRHQHQEFFIQEDELASWLQYPLGDLDQEIYPDLLSSPISAPTSPQRDTQSSVTEGRPQISVLPPVQHVQSTFIAARPPIALPTTSIVARPTIGLPPRNTDVEILAPRFQNFLNFSRVPMARIETGQSSVMKTLRELTTMDSNETPTAAGSSAQPSIRNMWNSSASPSTAGKGLATTCDLTMTTSSPGASVSASFETTPPMHKLTLTTSEEKKRKIHSQEKQPDDADSPSKEDEFGSGEGKKQPQKSTSVKRSRAAEVHNLSERKRRDKINEKMKALQELLPRCNKADKASMLDDAAEYLKSLKLQVQMLTMGRCGMVPMMCPGAQQYMPTMGMGMGMGMDMGMNNQPMMTYPTQDFPLQAPSFPMSPFPMQALPGLNPLAVQASNQAFQQPQVPVQNQVVVQPNTDNPSNGGDAGKPENHKTG